MKAGSVRRRVPPSRLQVLLPGLVHASLFTALAFLVAHFTGPFGVGAAALGVVFGVLAGNIAPPGATLQPGVRFVGSRILALAVVLLGLLVTLRDLAGLGTTAGVALVVAMPGALVAAFLLARLFRVSSPMAALIGAGTAVCGVAAIAAARPAVGAKQEELTYAVAAITFLGSLGLLVYPAVQLALHPFTAAQYGILSGATLHAVPQAIGAAFAAEGLAAGGVATVVKLSRVALLGVVVLLLGFLFRGRRDAGSASWRLPVEVWGFLGLFVLGSIFAVPDGFRGFVAEVDSVLLVWALTALGLQTRFSDLKRAGTAPLWVALITWGVMVAAVALVVLWV